jgi:hypothetical protein
MRRVRDGVESGRAFEPHRIRAHAEQFSRDRFLTAMAAEIASLVAAPEQDVARW